MEEKMQNERAEPRGKSGFKPPAFGIGLIADCYFAAQIGLLFGGFFAGAEAKSDDERKIKEDGTK